MNKQREALQLALEALTEVTGWQWVGPMRVMDEVEDAIAAIRETLTCKREALEMIAWSNDSKWQLTHEWTACVKLPVTVYVRAQRAGETHVSTREGITAVKPDDLIMRGINGEEYPIGREIFDRTYKLGEAPPARKPLTDAEIDNLELPPNGCTMRELVRAIERAHGIGVKHE